MEIYNSYEQLFHEMEILKKTFQVVRLILPKHDAELIICPETKEVTEVPYTCYNYELKDNKCDFCLVKYVFAKKEEFTKYEIVNGCIHIVICKYIQVEDAEYVLELIKFLNQDRFLDTYGKQEFIARTVKYHEGVYVDVLTGVYNRRYLIEHLPRMIRSARGSGDRLGIAMIDIDKFKQLNDQYGHLFGDHVLTKITKAINQYVDEAKKEFLARYGGDEFVLVLNDLDLEEMVQRVETMKNELKSKTIRYEDVEIPCAISIGIAHMQELEQPTYEKLLNLADEHLYIEKREKREKREKSKKVKSMKSNPF